MAFESRSVGAEFFRSRSGGLCAWSLSVNRRTDGVFAVAEGSDNAARLAVFRRLRPHLEIGARNSAFGFTGVVDRAAMTGIIEVYGEPGNPAIHNLDDATSGFAPLLRDFNLPSTRCGTL